MVAPRNIQKILLKTKRSGNVVVGELDKSEIIFGQAESSIFVKDLNSNLFKFSAIDDSDISSNKTWSSQKIVNYVSAGTYIDLIDGGTF